MALLGVILAIAAVVFILRRTYLLFLLRRSYLRHLKTVYIDVFPFTHMFRLKRDDEGFFEQLCGSSLAVDKPKVFHMLFATHPFVVLSGAEEFESILMNTKEITKSFEYRLLEPWLGNGLLTGSGNAWRARRKLLTPAFHSDILKDFMPVFNEQARILVDRLSEARGESVDAYPYITLCALDIICETAMGRNVSAQRKNDSAYVKAIYRLNDILHERHKSPWLWWDLPFYIIGRGREQDRCLKVIKGFTGQVIRERGEEHEKLRLGMISESDLGIPVAQDLDEEHFNDVTRCFMKRRLAFLDVLLKMKQNGDITDAGIQEEVDTFMFEGHDTTSAGMSWFLQLIGCHPKVQQKLHDELDSVFGASDRDVTYEDLKALTYLECCVKEALRLFPSVPLVGRHLMNDTKIGTEVIPAGSHLLLFAYGVHRDPKHWPDPDMFIPERFLPENAAGRHPFAYVPFAGGARNCIGQRFAIMEEKTVLAWILRVFSLESLKRTDQVRMSARLILRPVKGLDIRFIPRRS